VTKGLEKAGREIPGRPLSLKLAQTILSLEPDELYPPSKVARRIVDPVQQREEYQKWRKRAGDWVRYHCKEPDGQKGNFNAWLGSTWQEFIDPADRSRVEKCRARAAQAQQGHRFKKRWAMLSVAAVILAAAFIRMPRPRAQHEEIATMEPTLFASVPDKQSATSPLADLLAKQTTATPASEPEHLARQTPSEPEATVVKSELSSLAFALEMQKMHQSWQMRTFSHDSFITLVDTEREQATPLAVAKFAPYPVLLTRSNIAMPPF